MGGAGVLRLAARSPERFAAVVDVTGQVVLGPNLPERLVAEDRRTNLFLSHSDPYASLAQRIRDLPIWVHHGDADETAPVSESRRLVAALKNAEADARYPEYPGVGHEASERALVEPELMPWLLAQSRTKPK